MKEECDLCPPLIVGINGSLAKDGSASRNLQKTLAYVEKHGARTRLIHLIDFDIFPGKEYAFKKYQRVKPPPYINKDTQFLYDLLLAADGFILSTAVHWRFPASATVAFLEKINLLEGSNQLEGKVAGVIVNYGFEEGGVGNALCGAFVDMGLRVPLYGKVNCGFVSNIINSLGVVGSIVLKMNKGLRVELDGSDDWLAVLAQNVVNEAHALHKNGKPEKRFWK